MTETNAAGQITGCGSRNVFQCVCLGTVSDPEHKAAGNRVGGGSMDGGEAGRAFGRTAGSGSDCSGRNDPGTGLYDTVKDFCSKPQKSLIGGAIHGN